MIRRPTSFGYTLPRLARIDSRREQEKYNPSTDTGLGDERKAGDHIYDRRAEWNCREQAGRKPE